MKVISRCVTSTLVDDRKDRNDECLICSECIMRDDKVVKLILFAGLANSRIEKYFDYLGATKERRIESKDESRPSKCIY